MHRFALLGAGLIGLGARHQPCQPSARRTSFSSTTSIQLEPSGWVRAYTGRRQRTILRRRSTRTASTPSSLPRPQTLTPTTCAALPMQELAVQCEEADRPRPGPRHECRPLCREPRHILRWSTSTGVSTVTTRKSNVLSPLGEIGDVELIQLTSRGPAMPPLEYIAVSGGQMRDQTVHFFDSARWISGLDPGRGVRGRLRARRTPSRRSRRRRHLRRHAPTPGGALVQIDSTRRVGYGYDERMEVLGSTGMIEARRQRTGSVSRYQAGHVIDDGMHAPGWFERVQPTYAAAPRPLCALLG